MCRPKKSCTLNQGSNFEAAFVIAHEMGHRYVYVSTNIPVDKSQHDNDLKTLGCIVVPPSPMKHAAIHTGIDFIYESINACISKDE